jgi:hypothetical protein
MRRTLGLMGLLVAVGCDPDFGTFERQKNVDEWQQTPTDQVDILWVVDNSNSMQLEQDLLAAGFSSFAQELEETSTNFHLGVITTDFEYDSPDRGRLIGDPKFISPDDEDYEALFIDRARVGLNGSGKEKGLEAADYALSASMSTGFNSGFLRPEANLLIVFVSDEDDCSDEGGLGLADNTACYSDRDKLVPVEEFVQRFQALKPTKDKVQIGAIVGPEDATAICDDTTLPGRRYIDVARFTGGLVGSICDTDWSTFLYDLGLNAAGIFTTFELEHGAEPGTLVVEIDGAVVPEDPFDGYTYDDVALAITFHGLWIPERGATIVARYTIQSGT